jgi:hypothetical protein
MCVGHYLADVIRASRQNLLHEMPVHVGETEMAALVFVGEALVVDTEEVHHGGVKVVHNS